METEEYNEPCMRPYPLANEARLVCVAANMGLGKTQAVVQLCSSLPDAARVLVVSANTLLCRELMASLPNIKLYRGLPKGAIVPGRIVVGINSIMRIMPYTPQNLLVVGEAVMVVHALNSNLMAKYARCNGCTRGRRAPSRC